MVSGHVSELADGLLGHFVTLARESGASWVAIGECMGTSKQAAQKRFMNLRRRRGGFFLNRLSEDARTIVRRTVEPAREMGSAEVQPDHVVLALLEGSVVSWAVGDLTGSADEISAGIRSRMTTGSGHARGGHLPFSHRAKIALELALRGRRFTPVSVRSAWSTSSTASSARGRPKASGSSTRRASPGRRSRSGSPPAVDAGGEPPSPEEPPPGPACRPR